MRILIVSRYVVYPSWQGPAQHVQTFAKALVDQGNEVFVASGEDVLQEDSIEQDGYKIVRIPMNRSGGKLESLLSISSHDKDCALIAKRLLQEWNPDVVHIGVMVQMASFVEVAHDMGYPIVAIIHDYSWLCYTKFLINYQGRFCNGPEDKNKCLLCVTKQLSRKRRIASDVFMKLENFNLIPSYFSKNLEKKLNIYGQVSESFDYMKRIRKYVDFFIAQTPITKEIIEKYDVESDKIILIGQWLSEEKLKVNIPKERRQTDSKIRIGFVGRLDYEKGLHVLGEAIRLLNQPEKLELWILSSGATMDRVQSLTGNLPNNLKIRMFGELQGDDALPRVISELDLTVVPSIWAETGPRVLLEALAQKIPCIATDQLGNSFMIKDHVNGRLFKMGDSNELSEILNNIVENPGMIMEWAQNIPKVMGRDEWLDRIIALHNLAIASKGKT